MSIVTAQSPVAGLLQAQALRFNPGEFIVATVLGMVDASTVRLQLPHGAANFPADQTFASGTRVGVNIGGTATNPSVTIAPLLESAVRSQRLPATDTSLSVQQRAASIVSDAAARQDGMAPLFADLAGLAQRGQALPQPVAAIVRQLLGASLDVSGKTGVSAADIKTALMQSGLVASAAPPTAAVPTPAATASSASKTPTAQLAGLTLLLGLLRRSLTNWTDAEQVDASQADMALARRPSLAPQVDVAQSSRGVVPPPPFRNGPTVPQPVVQAALPEDMSGPALAHHLLDRTEAAIARQTLLQVASLSDADPAAAKSGGEARHLIFDVPLATPQGIAIAQFRIEQDESRSDTDTDAGTPMWRASFAIDIEPIGCVHAHIALMGDRTSVTLRADRPDSTVRLNDGVEELEALLREADLEPGTIACVNGATSAQPSAAAPGLFLDSTT